MPDRLPRELRVVYEVARVAALGSYTPEEVLERICAVVQSEFGFASVRVVRGGDELVDSALVLRRAVVEGDRAAVPLLVDGCCLGHLLCEGCRRELDELDLQMLSTVGLVSGIFAAKAQGYEDLRRADELKNQFVSTASHELRAPIAIVYGIAGTLLARGDELSVGQSRELRQALFDQSGHLRDLTEQLLDLSRLDAGRIAVHPRAFRPLDSVEALLPRIAPDRVDDVQVEIDPGVELVSDQDAFERVVGNLIDNALEYGAPPVVVSGGTSESTFRLAVEDNGPGVPLDFVPRLFDRFTRAGEERGRGVGLGLAIAQEFAVAVGAELGYEPAEPQGARFVFAVPRRPSAARP